MKLKYHSISDTGLRRNNNEDMAMVADSLVRDGEDSFSFQLPDEGIKFGAIVCDGVGGLPNGELASEIACGKFRTFVEELPDDLDDNALIQALKLWTRETNADILTESNGSGMACTLTGILLYYDRAYILNIGDSRTYRLRYGTLRQLTTDHSERDRTGDMSIPPSIIYNCLGIQDCFIDVTPTRVVAGDVFVVCSDGLSDVVPEESLASILAGETRTAEELIEAAKTAGAPDNVTVILLEFSE